MIDITDTYSGLIQWGLVMCLCIIELSQHFRQSMVACLAPSHYQKQSLFVFNEHSRTCFNSVTQSMYIQIQIRIFKIQTFSSKELQLKLLLAKYQLFCLGLLVLNLLHVKDIASLVQDCSNSSALARELLQYCTKPWNYGVCIWLHFL